MKVSELTCKPSDWTNKKDVTVKVRTYVDGRQTFSLFGYDFTLSPVKVTKDDEPPASANEGDYDYYSRTLTSPSWDHPLCKVVKFGKDRCWETSGTHVRRDDPDPLVAVIQTLCNII